MKMVYRCEDSFEGILCGVYYAWTSRRGHANVRLELSDTVGDMELFCEYQEVYTDPQIAGKVINSVRTNISDEVYEMIYTASLSREAGRADMIYRFLIYGFHVGAKVTQMLQIPEVFQIFEMYRNISHEVHLLTGFVRFSMMEEKVLVSRIGPKNDVLVLLAPHFADRMSGENWIIYDEIRKKAIFHPAGGTWLLIHPDSREWEGRILKAAVEDSYEELWMCFCKSIAVEERTNPICQRNHLPLRYRTYMTEFDGGRKGGTGTN